MGQFADTPFNVLIVFRVVTTLKFEMLQSYAWPGYCTAVSLLLARRERPNCRRTKSIWTLVIRTFRNKGSRESRVDFVGESEIAPNMYGQPLTNFSLVQTTLETFRVYFVDHRSG
jgi:hypothetical protein